MRSLLLLALALPLDALAGPLAAFADADSKANNYDDAVKTAMLAAYDKNGDGWVKKKELAAIPCDEWAALDASVKRGWDGNSARVIYGFRADLLWVGYAWGLHERGRKAADAQLAACGL